MTLSYDDQLRYILSIIKNYNINKFNYGVLFYFDLEELEKSDADVEIIKENIGSDVDKLIIGVIPIENTIVNEDQINLFYRLLKKKMGYFVYASDYRIMKMNTIINLIEKEIEDIENGY